MCSLPHVFRKILNNFPDSKSDHRCEGDGQEMARSQGEDHKCEGWICGCDQHRVRRISVYLRVVKLSSIHSKETDALNWVLVSVL